MISPEALIEKLRTFVELQGFDPERHRLAMYAVRCIHPQIYDLIRREVAQAKKEALARYAS